ncbi:MAG: MFS transporter, partial [Chloroflexota bacterium]|nr:MFS transporter [Chloroflexota bacterium]
ALLLTALLALAVARASAFAPVALLVALLAVAQAPIAPLLDGYAVTVAERAGSSYGALRVWGSVGFTVAALAVGRLMGDRVSNLVLLAYAACLALGLVAVLGLSPLGERAAHPIFGSLGLLARNRPLAVLLLTAYLISTGGALLYNFLGIHLQELGASADLVGVAVAIGAASEFPVVAFGGRFLVRLGAPRLVALAILVYAARFAALTVIPSPAWTLPIQALHGLSFGAFLIASVPLVHRLAGPGQAATAQALLTAMSFGLGSITGSLLGGALLDRIGTVGLFRGAVGLMLLTLAVFLAGERAAGAPPSSTRNGDADRPRRPSPS